MESQEAVAAKRRVLIDALMVCLNKSRVMQVVDAKGSITVQQRIVRTLIAPYVQLGRGEAVVGDITHDESV